MKGRTTVHAVVGKNVTLPCIFNTTFSLQTNTLEWSVHGLEIYVFKNQKGDIQNPKYTKNGATRISISAENLEKGNASIQLSYVKTSDNGTYRCCITVKKTNCTEVTLGKNFIHHISKTIM